MQNFYKIGKVDTTPIKAALTEKEYLWNQNPDRLMGFNLVEKAEFDDIWVHMPVSAVNMSRDEIMANLAVASHGTKWHKAYYDLPVKPILMHIFSHLDAEAFGRVFISRLMPGKNIFEHKDIDLDAFARFHVAIDNYPGAVFKCDGEDFTPETGDVFWFNNSKNHSVINNSEFPRLTMVVDLVTPWRQYLFDGEFNK